MRLADGGLVAVYCAGARAGVAAVAATLLELGLVDVHITFDDDEEGSAGDMTDETAGGLPDDAPLTWEAIREVAPGLRVDNLDVPLEELRTVGDLRRAMKRASEGA